MSIRVVPDMCIQGVRCHSTASDIPYLSYPHPSAAALWSLAAVLLMIILSHRLQLCLQYHNLLVLYKHARSRIQRKVSVTLTKPWLIRLLVMELIPGKWRLKDENLNLTELDSKIKNSSDLHPVANGKSYVLQRQFDCNLAPPVTRNEKPIEGFHL